MLLISRKPARILPFGAATALQYAASINPNVPVGLSGERTRALEATIAAVKKANPQFFRR